MRQILLILLFFLLSLNTFSRTNDSIYSVRLENFSEKIYSETKSRFRLIMKGIYKIPDTPFQKTLNIESSTDQSIIAILAGDLDDETKESPVLPGSYLENTRLLNLDDPQIQSLKRRFSDSKDTLNDVEDFVYDYIKNKTIGIPIIPASEILKIRSGDCTEHTVLAVSILRSLGIPTRALAGMLLCREFEGRKNVFVYHMWAEAFVKNKWVLVDAANPGEKHANRYIAFSYHHLRTEMPLAYFKAVTAIKSLSVEYTK